MLFSSLSSYGIQQPSVVYPSGSQSSSLSSYGIQQPSVYQTGGTDALSALASLGRRRRNVDNNAEIRKIKKKEKIQVLLIYLKDVFYNL